MFTSQVLVLLCQSSQVMSVLLFNVPTERLEMLSGIKELVYTDREEQASETTGSGNQEQLVTAKHFMYNNPVDWTVFFFLATYTLAKIRCNLVSGLLEALQNC